MNKIKQILDKKGIKQTWLAEQLGKSFNTVNAYTQNRQQPGLEVLFTIASILNVDVRDLIDDSANQNRKFTVIDLFAGCGGLTEGFMQTGSYEPIAHVEWELPMVQTLRNRLSTQWEHDADESLKRVIHFDIQKTHELLFGNWTQKTRDKFQSTNHPEIVEKGLSNLIGDKDLDLIIGGPPCQAYSIAGRAQDPNSMKDDYRNYLFESFVEIVKEYRPKVFLFENVPGLLSACPGGIPVTQRIHKAFRKIGYTIKKPDEMSEALYVSSDFGVPQKRKRVILIGVREDQKFDHNDIYSEISSGRNRNDKKNVKSAIGHLPEFYPLEKPSKMNGKKVSHQADTENLPPHHYPRFHNQRDIKIFEKWIENEMNNSTSSEKLSFYNDLFGKKSNHIKYRNLEWDQLSPTIVAHLYKDGLMFIHPDKNQARSITIKEAALLQSFPDDYEFIGNQGDKYKMIGNAVPPLMAREIAHSVARILK